MYDVQQTWNTLNQAVQSSIPFRHRQISQNGIISMPSDVLLEVASYLNSISDRLHFSRTSSRIYPKVIQTIYADVELQGIEQCEKTLSMLARSPPLARHVQKLVVHPECRNNFKKREYINSWQNAHIASQLVGEAAKNMDAMKSFVWDGEDTLPDDRMWGELRNLCPSLTFVGTSFGSFLPGPNSHLFAFKDLKGFSLTFKGGFYAHQLHIPTRESSPVFSKLWEMLTVRCPNLESLALCGTYHEAADVSRLASARWPSLRSITVGDVVFDPLSEHQNSPNQSFLDFLERHPCIESLSVHGHPDVAPVNLGALDENALPNLKSFSGTLDRLRALAGRGILNAAQNNLVPNNVNQNQQAPLQITSSALSSTLHTICFPEPMQLRDLTPLAISGVLMGMHALKSLTIAFSLQSGYDSNGVLRTIVSSCPNLMNLDLTCACKPSFYLETFSRTLRNLSKLRTLSLTIVKVPGDEPMHAGAARIAHSNPRLHHFTITYLPPNMFVTRGLPHPRPLEVGHYELVCDSHGIPVSLLANERRKVSWGTPTLIRRRTKKWVCELRPYGHPDVAKNSWGEILLERSPAGEEARLLAFCLWLMILAAWGVWRAVVWNVI